MPQEPDNQSVVPDGWEEFVGRWQARLAPQPKRAEKLGRVFVLGVFLFGFGTLFCVLLPNPFRSWWFSAGFALTILCIGGASFNLIRSTVLKDQLDKQLVFGGRSLLKLTNRVLLTSEPNRLHVRLSGVLIAVMLLMATCGLLFFGVGVVGVLEAWANPDAVIGGRHALRTPVWLFGLIMMAFSVPFLALVIPPLVFGWRMDFDKRKGTFTLWNWFRRHELPLAMIESVEGGYSVNLRLRDRTGSRIHVMNNPGPMPEAQVLREFLGLETA